MRLTPINLSTLYYINGHRPKNGRRPTRVPFPFNGCLPLELRDHVSGKSAKQQSNPCLHEMAIMFACFKKNDFAQALCSKEIQALRACHLNHMNTQQKKKEQQLQSLLAPGEKNLTHKQVNHLLKMYRQPK